MTAAPRPIGKRPEGRIGWLEQTLAAITGSIEQAVFTERHARLAGWLQRVDPRAKLGHVPGRHPGGQLHGLGRRSWRSCTRGLLAAARASRVPFGFFVKRVWLGIPFFAGIVVMPAIFFVPGPRLFDLALGPVHVAPSVARPGRGGALRRPGRRLASRSPSCS